MTTDSGYTANTHAIAARLYTQPSAEAAYVA